MKTLLIELGILLSLTAMIGGSFLYDYSFMNGYWQYGPVILFSLLILLLAGHEHFLKKDSEYEHKKADNNDESPANFRYVIRTSLLVIYVIILASTMKFVFGPPERSTYDIGDMNFWMLFTIIILTMCYRVWNTNSAKMRGL